MLRTSQHQLQRVEVDEEIMDYGPHLSTTPPPVLSSFEDATPQITHQQEVLRSLVKSVSFNRASQDLNNKFSRLIITNDGKLVLFAPSNSFADIDLHEHVEVCEFLVQAMNLRDKYVYKPKLLWKHEATPAEKPPFDPFNCEIPGPSGVSSTLY